MPASQPPFELHVVIASTRPGRVGLPVSRWFVPIAEADERFAVTVDDLAEIDLPFMDEPNHPRLQRYTQEHTKAWSARVDSADAFVFVTSEYNYGTPAPLKNAIDYLNREWKYKPVGFVSYGGVSAGTRSVLQAKQALVALGTMPTIAAVNIPFVAKLIDDDGELQANEVMEKAAAALLDELAALSGAMRALRG